MAKIFALEKEYKIKRKIRLKLDKIEKFLIWSVSQDQIAVKAFLNTIQPIRRSVLGFTKLTRLLTYLTGKTEWRWTESKELAFQILWHRYTTKAIIFRSDFILLVNLYSNTSNFEAEYYIT